MPEPIAREPDPQTARARAPAAPPAPSYRGAIAGSTVLLALWAVFTVFARPLTPVVIAIAEWVEMRGGWDMSLGEEEYRRPGEVPPKPPKPVRPPAKVAPHPPARPMAPDPTPADPQ